MSSDNKTPTASWKPTRRRVVAGMAATPGIDDGVGAAARFQYPGGIAADGVGDLWVADTGNSRLEEFNAKHPANR